MDIKKAISLLKALIEEKRPKISKELDEIYKNWWDNLHEDTRYEIIKEISKGTILDDIIVKCGCNSGNQRCAVAV